MVYSICVSLWTTVKAEWYRTDYDTELFPRVGDLWGHVLVLLRPLRGQVYYSFRCCPIKKKSLAAKNLIH